MNIKESFLYTTPVAHRGLHDNTIAENSYLAFQRAIDLGYAIEMDVRFSKDKKIVVFHDDTLKRLTGVDKMVKDCTFEELQTYRISGSDQKIPLFSEFLRFVDGKVPLLIEIKNMSGVNDLVPTLIEELKGYKGEYALQSFNPMYVKQCKQYAPQIFAGQLACRSKKEDFIYSPAFWRIKSFAMEHMMVNWFARPDFISYCVENLPYKKAMRYASKKNRLLLSWVVRTEEDYERMKPIADNVIFENIRPPFQK